jgi:fatty acid desaturase
MQEVFARKDLISPAALRALCEASDRAGWVQAGSHFGAILLTGAALSQLWGSVWAVPVFLLHGVLINFLYAGQHELSHWTVFRTRWLNEWIRRLIGLISFFPRDFDQIQHTAHHRHTQDWARDGELARDRYTFWSYLWWLLGPTYWYTRWRRILRFSFGIVTEPYIPQSRRADMIREARWHLAIYAAIAAVSVASGSWAAVLYWLGPMVLTKAAHQLQNTIEHLGLPHEANILENTRSTRTNAVLRWMCWNMQYHTAHHAFPGVPFYRLPDLHAALFTARGATPPMMTYLGFQAAVLRAFWPNRTEADYPDDRTWIGGRKV